MSIQKIFLNTRLREKIANYFERFPLYMKLRHKTEFPNKSIVIITIDSLRYDVADGAYTPNIRKLLSAVNISRWYKVGSHGTYTLPSHISMFHAGIMPCNNQKDIPIPYNREKLRVFKAQLAWDRQSEAMFPTPAAPNIIKGFAKIGYRTIGIGGVHWFNDKFITSNFWRKHYFSEFYWNENFSETCFHAFENQINKIKELKLAHANDPIFLFLNIASTHSPYMGFGKSVEAQKNAFEYVDKHIPQLFDFLPNEFVLMLLSDHGECFGEDELWGHGFYHPKIMEVPFVYLEVKKEQICF